MKSGVLLLSGGFDSPVAGYLMQKAGMSLVALHCSLHPVVNDASENKVKQLAEILQIPLLSVRVGKELSDMIPYINNRYYFILQKRFMIRLGEHLATLIGGNSIVTGESLGQVSSQTLPNLLAISQVATLPIHRPLLTYSKQDIIDLAKKIGTYTASIGPEMCDSLGPAHPVTKATIEQVLREEGHIPLEALLMPIYHKIASQFQDLAHSEHIIL